MKRRGQVLLSLCCLCVLLLNGAGALAQTQEKMPPPEKRGGGRVVVTTMPPGGEPEGQGNLVITRSGEGGAVTFEGNSFSFISSEMNFEGKVVKGAPYSAEAVNESVQTLADGNRIVRKSTTLLYRDSEGRMRREQDMNNVGPFATGSDAPRLIFINDPVAGVNYTLDTRTHIARKGMMYAYAFTTTRPEKIGPPPPGEPPMGPPPMGMGEGPPKPPPPGALRHEATKRVEPEYPPIARAAGAQGNVTVQVVIDEQGNVASARAISGHPLLQQAAVDAARQWVFKPTVVDSKPAKVNGTIGFSFVMDRKEGEPLRPEPPLPPKFPEAEESLGRQTIEGVAADGTRVTVTIPAGTMGNERPINIVTERWYSPELQTVVMTKHSDPRFGETTYRLTNINRSEPAHSLFEVPADFEIKQPGPEKREFRMQREKMPQ
ncbi:MAG: energy transducer TonB [Pyrinomonadaceae bacterium]